MESMQEHVWFFLISFFSTVYDFALAGLTERQLTAARAALRRWKNHQFTSLKVSDVCFTGVVVEFGAKNKESGEKMSRPHPHPEECHILDTISSRPNWCVCCLWLVQDELLTYAVLLKEANAISVELKKKVRCRKFVQQIPVLTAVPVLLIFQDLVHVLHHFAADDLCLARSFCFWLHLSTVFILWPLLGWIPLEVQIRFYCFCQSC